MEKKLAYVGIAVLVVIAVVLGYQIYQQQTGYNTPEQNNQQYVTPQVPINTQQTNQPAIESLLKRFVAPHNSPEEKAKFFSDLNAVAKETDLLSVTNCKPNPSVLKVKKGSSFKITNEDNRSITLGIIEQNIIINSKSTVTVEANWEGATGLHCESSIVGILYTI